MGLKRIRRYGILGLIGIIGVGVGEFLLHFSSLGYNESEAFSFFKHIPLGNITVGHFLAVLSMPLYFAVYYHLYCILKPARPLLAKVMFHLAMYIFALGGIWIGSRAVLWVMYQGGFKSGLDAYITYNESLLQILRVGLIAVSIMFGVIVWTQKTILPRWVAFANPATLLAIVFAIFLGLPQVGKYLMPTALNVAHFVLVSITLYYSYTSKQKE